MKTLYKFLLIFTFISCKAQTPIFDRYNNDGYGIRNAYYKDIQHFQDQFIGTWLYTNGATSLKVIFQKKIMFYNGGITPYYVDFLIGEYQYIENGIEKVNSLSNLSINHSVIYDYNLVSSTQYDNNQGEPNCRECPEGTKRLRMKFDEPANDDAGLAANFVIRREVENGVEKLKVQFAKISTAAGLRKPDMMGTSTMVDFTLPYGNYTLIKQ